MTTFRTCLRWLAVLIVGAVPAVVHGETFSFKNECQASLIVQILTVQKGTLKRDQCLLRHGESTPKLPLDTDKMITVLDAKTGRILFREALRVSKTPLNYAIVLDQRNMSRVLMKPIADSTETTHLATGKAGAKKDGPAKGEAAKKDAPAKAPAKKN